MDIENQYGTLQMQESLLSLLKIFHRFCVDHEIEYSLDWGSLLGAVRHKGFIPWDDDLDVMVDRTNYNKLKKAIHSSSLVMEREKRALWIEKVRRDDNARQEGYPPTIDIFIMDNAPDGKWARKMRLISLMFLQGMMKQHPNFKRGNILYRIATLVTFALGKLFPASWKIKWYDCLMRKSNNKVTQRKACYNSIFQYMPKLYDYDVVKKVEAVPFEDTVAYITTGYHQCLVDKYGPNYMTPPSMEDRIPSHMQTNNE